MRRFMRGLFILSGGPFWLAVLRGRGPVPQNFRGHQPVLGRYPENLPLLHRCIVSWWQMPMRCYDEAYRERRLLNVR